MAEPQSPIVTSAWLAEHLNDPGMAVVDASWYLPAQKRDGRDDAGLRHRR